MKIPIGFTVWATMELECDSLEEAKEYAENLGDCDHPFVIDQVIDVNADMYDLEEMEDE